MIGAGHLYRFTYRTFIAASDAGDGDASAPGGLSLRILPEPTAGMPSGIALLVLAAQGGRGGEVRRRQAS